MKSKTLIEKQIKKKTKKPLLDVILLAKKNSAWTELASILSGPSRKLRIFNLLEIEKAGGKEILVVPGKVLSDGKISKKIKIAALNYSEKAKEKLLKAGCEVLLLDELINKNKDAKGVKILK